MGDKKIQKNELLKILDNNINEYDIMAPIKCDNILDFGYVKTIDDIVLSDDLPYKSPKEVYFPQTEKVLTYDNDMNVRIHKSKSKKLLFGARPCDLKALMIMTEVFTKGDFIDDIFKNNVENTTIIGVGCIELKNGCFCSDLGILKNYSSYCDAFLNIIDGGYEVSVFTKKGKKIFADYNITEKKLDTKSIKLVLKSNEKELFENVDWEKLTQKCMSCGICTFICPTCHCFEFKDIKKDDCIERYRCWDSCMNPKFTLHASGHNPRTKKADRFRQRVMHKYVYLKKNVGHTACTGCGRCIRNCPAGMSIKNIVESIMEDS